MIVHQVQFKKRGKRELKFSDISKKLHLNYGLSTCKFPSTVKLPDLLAALLMEACILRFQLGLSGTAVALLFCK